MQTMRLASKWNRFWRGLNDQERLSVLRLLGYKGVMPKISISGVLIAALLVAKLGGSLGAAQMVVNKEDK